MMPPGKGVFRQILGWNKCSNSFRRIPIINMERFLERYA